MRNDILREATAILARNRRRRAWKKVVIVFACIAVFCTTYALILPALTMDQAAYCGKAPHEHDPACYEKTLICEAEGSADHVHTDACYTQSLICEQEAHTHTLGCYSDPEADVENAEVWAHSTSGVKLTTNWRGDLIAMAKSQLGYTESDKNYTVADDGETKKGYTRYGAWYGNAYGDWCAMFVSFCLHYAGIPVESFPQEANCAQWVAKLQGEDFGFYAAADGYAPLVGDLIFFDGDGDGSANHVGLVAERTVDEEGTLTGIKTIEGNAENQVKYVTYSVDDKAILGYASLPDNPNERFTQTFAGADYTVTATYGLEAEIPKNAALIASEYAKDSEHYQQRYEEAAKLYGWSGDRRGSIRLFNIGFYVDGVEIEPAAGVEITITYANQEQAGNYEILHFGREPEALKVESTYGDGEQSLDFTLDHFSDIMSVGQEPATPVKPGTVQGVTPNGTVINVFDYWLTDRVSTNPEGDRGEGNQATAGINAGHALKFTPNGFGTTTNKWTESKAPRKGLVVNQLGEDGYPCLTASAAEQSGTSDKNAESLAYLFNPAMDNTHKQTFRNVGGLLQIDEKGYYYYDSRLNFAELDETAKMFTLYNTWAVERNGIQGQFFPFNKFAEAKGLRSDSAKINHYFGLTMTSRFVQRYGGHTNTSRKTNTVFEFAGDDDVWVFIDGVLVGDLGGIHDRAELAIDFATGKVSINGNVVRTLKQAFEEAGVTTTVDEWNGDTFADNTYHTLKFYYLERGNYDSNMRLKYNLTAVPETSIYKVDQYGQFLSDVEFKVYNSGADWLYSPDDLVYTGKTDANGKLTFVDEDKMPYTLKELKKKFGEYCILKETNAPPGYRSVGSEVHLRISDTALWCANTYDSGVWAMVTLQVSSPTQLKLVDGALKDFYEFDGEPGTSHGTLFAVVVKRINNGPIEEQESWAPVSGNSKDGYTVWQATDGRDFIQKAIGAAKDKVRNGRNAVFEMAASGAMELSMRDLPGHIMEYYYMLPADQKDKAQYTTAYYWTEGSLEEATPENTFRVNADALAPNAFDRTFGATIEVPNLCNRLLVQKFDRNGQKVNNAIFALFRANADGTYIADDGSAVTLVEGQYTVEVHFDSEDDTQNYAVITTDDGKKITSVEQRRTNNIVLDGEEGTCVFGIRQKPLEEGCYYLHEVEAPFGYKINPHPVMVRVTDSAVYANAGTANDGIQVARGPGYISSTLHKAASPGAIDNTLTWIYQMLRVSPESNSFLAAVPSNITNWEYAKDEAGKILASYLEYTRTPQHLGVNRFLANYVVDETNDRVVMNETVRTRTQQIATDVGWSYNEIYQGYEYGSKHTEAGTTYTDLSGYGDISNLFSRSVFVQVTDEPKYSNLEISKTVIEDTDHETEFTFTVTVEGATGTYNYDIYNITDRNTSIANGTITGGGTVRLKNGQVAVIRNLPGDGKYTVSETPVSSYNAVYSIDGAAAVAGFEASGILKWEDGNPANSVSKVAFTNTYAPSLDLTVYKYAAGTTNPLSGAKFVLYTTAGTPTYYYENGSWVTLGDGKTPESLALTTGADGTVKFTGIPDGTYALKEIAAPDGYHLLEQPISFTVSGGTVVAGTNFTDTTITVYNNAGHELPETGGIGTKQLTAAGLLLTVGAGILLLRGRKKRKKEDGASF